MRVIALAAPLAMLTTTCFAQAPQPQESDFVKGLINKSRGLSGVNRSQSGVRPLRPQNGISSVGSPVVVVGRGIGFDTRHRRGLYDSRFSRQERARRRERVRASQQQWLNELQRRAERRAEKKERKRRTRQALAEARARNAEERRASNRRKIELMNSRKKDASDRAEQLLIAAMKAEERSAFLAATALYEIIVKNYGQSTQAAEAKEALARLSEQSKPEPK